MTGRAFLFAVAALLIVRMCLTAHAPSFVDAHACLAALALAFVAGAARPAQIAAALLTVGLVSSVPGSWDPWISLLALPAVLGPIALFLLASSGSCRSALLAAIGIGGALNAVAAFVQKFITWPSALARMNELGLDPAQAARLAGARPIGLSLSPDLAGGLCLAGALCAAALAVEMAARAPALATSVTPTGNAAPSGRPTWLPAALGATAAVSASGLLMVRSFGCALALVVGIAVSALLLAARRGQRQALIVAGAGFVVAGLALVIAVAARGADALARSAGERSENWRAALEVFSDAPLFGVGLMRFGNAYLGVRGPEANVTRYAHSGPLQLLAETGLVGAALTAVAFALIVRALWQRRASLSTSDRIVAGAAAALTVRACIDYDLHVSQSASVFAVLLGLLIARDDPAPADRNQRRALAALAMVALALVAVLGVRQGALESEDRSTLASYIDVLPFDAEPRIALAAQAVDALVICNDHASCVAARETVFAVLEPLCARRHPPPVALVLRARAHASIGHLNEALADSDAALTIDRGSGPAHQLGVAVARALKRDDVDARISAATVWGVSVEEP